MKKLAIIDARHQQPFGNDTIAQLGAFEFINKTTHSSSMRQPCQTVIIFAVNEYDFRHICNLEKKLALFCQKYNIQFAKERCTGGHYDVIQREKLIQVTDEYATHNDNVIVITPEWLDDQIMHGKLSLDTEEIVSWFCRHYLPTIAKNDLNNHRVAIVDFENSTLSLR